MPRRFRKPPRKLRVETLESRLNLATLTVTSLADQVQADNFLTLREALEVVNTQDVSALTGYEQGSISGTLGTDDRIVFDTSVFRGGATIMLELGELSIQRPVVIESIDVPDVTIDANHLSRIFNINDGDANNQTAVTLKDLRLTNGNATGNGGAILNSEALLLDQLFLEWNSATESGGAIANDGGSLVVESTTISTNTAYTEGASGGGGIFNQSGSVSLNNSFVYRNSTYNRISSFGGGILGPNLTISNSSIFSNSAANGAGIFALGLTMWNSTVSENYATANAGGVYSFGDLRVTNSTIANNHVSANNVGAGLVVFSSATNVLHNTLVAGNDANGVPADITGTLDPSSSHNLVGDAASSGGLSGNGNLVGVDPLLTLVFVKEGTQLAHVLGAGSPAVDAGDNALAFDALNQPLTTDQRGAPRLSNTTVDIGAVERQQQASPYLVEKYDTDDIDGNYGPGQLTLREAVLLANDNPTADTIQFAFDLNNPYYSNYIFDYEYTRFLAARIGPELIFTDPATTTIQGNGGVVITGEYNYYSHLFTEVDDRILNVAYTANVELNGVWITGGKSDFGGGISNEGTLTVIDSMICGNSALYGGGIGNDSGSLTIINSILDDNIATVDGGGIYAYDSDVTIINSTIADNSAGRNGGGIHNFSSLVQLTHVTLVGNRADTDGDAEGTGGGISTGGGLFFPAETLLANTIVSGNLLNGLPSDLEGDPVDPSSHHNLIGDLNSAGGLQHQVNGNQVGVDPLLSPLQDNGGTWETFHLLPGSPALDAGDNAAAVDNGTPLATDQRGLARIAGGTVDIGAVERQVLAGPYVVDTSDDVLNGDYSPGNVSLAEAVLLANDHLGEDAITFAPGISTVTLTRDELRFADPAKTTVRGGTGVTIQRSAEITTPYFRILHADQNTVLDLEYLTLRNGYQSQGSAIRNAGTLTMSYVTIRDNGVGGSYADGSVIYSFGSPTASLAIANSLIEQNQIRDFGKVIAASNLVITDSQIVDNVGGGVGVGYSAMIHASGDVIISRTVVARNTKMAGIWITGGNGKIVDSTISNNQGTGILLGYPRDGGPLFSNTPVLDVVNTTISGNYDGFGAGGIANWYSTLNVVNSTVTNNTAITEGLVGAGGGIYTVSLLFAYDNGITKLQNSIIAGNHYLANPSDLIGIDYDELNNLDPASSHNLIGDAATAGGLQNGVNGNLVGVDPLLGPLQNNGGPTFTHALLPGSSAVDAGDNSLAVDSQGNPLTTDQRGRTRIQDSVVDIGAFELSTFVPVNLVVDSAADVVDGDYTAGQLSLREAVQIANERTGPDEITFAIGLVELTAGTLVLTDTAATTLTGHATVQRSYADGVPQFPIFGVVTSATAAITGLDIRNGSETRPFTTTPGGGIYNDGTLTVSNSVLSDNEGLWGGSAIENTGTLIITDSLFQLNKGNTGTLHNNGGIVMISNSWFKQNDALLGGAGIYNDDGGVANIQGTTFSENTGSGTGTAIRNRASLTLVNSSVSGNLTSYEGGGIHNRGTLLITNSTITNNRSSQHGGDALGGGIWTVENGTTLHNSIVAGNWTGSPHFGPQVNDDIFGSVHSASSYNLIGDAASAGGLQNGVNFNTVGADPLLAPLGHSDGQLGPVHKLRLGSPAISGGHNALAVDAQQVPLTSDQLSQARIVGGTVDLGAVEFDPIIPYHPSDLNYDLMVDIVDILKEVFVFNKYNGQLPISVQSMAAEDRNADTSQNGTFELPDLLRMVFAFNFEVQTGSETANTLIGAPGNDILVGLGGDDTLIGNAGNDILLGGNGNDVYRFLSATDPERNLIADAAGDSDVVEFDFSDDKLQGFYLTDLDENGIFESINLVMLSNRGLFSVLFQDFFSNSVAFDYGTGRIETIRFVDLVIAGDDIFNYIA